MLALRSEAVTRAQVHVIQIGPEIARVVGRVAVDVGRFGQILAGGDQVAAALEVGDQQILIGLGQWCGHRRGAVVYEVVAGEPDHDLVGLKLANVGQRLRLARQRIDV